MVEKITLTEDELRDVMQARQRFEAYTGDEYFVADWVDENTTREQAIAELQDPFILSILLSMNGLEYILADKYATAGLKRLLMAGNPSILAQLVKYAEKRKKPKKPGPRPKNGKYIREQTVELRQTGLSYGKIAKVVYGDTSKRNLVSAHLSQAKKQTKEHPPRVVPQRVPPQ